MSPTGAVAHSRLADLVGSARVIADPAQLSLYEIDGTRPFASLQPESNMQISEIIKFAAAERLGIVATGGRTKLNIGLPPKRYDLALDVSSLNKIIAYDPGDLTLSVEAGLPLAKLAPILAEHHQFLPLPVPFVSHTTIGGIIATGVDGPLRQFYGTARDFLLGMEFVTGEGVAAKSGGRVVKNVTGYDIHKLMVGALGTLGVITRLNFKTFPMLTSSRAFMATFQTVERACGMRNRVSQSHLTPVTMEIFSPGVAELFSSEAASRVAPTSLPKDLLSKARWTFTSGFSGNPNTLTRYETELRKMAEECGAVDATVLEGSELASAFALKREFIPIALESSPATTIIKISVLPRQMSEALANAAREADNNRLRWVAMARGSGVVYFAILPTESNDATKRQVLQAADNILAACAALGGHATIPWCPPQWKNELKVWGLPRADFAQMLKLKKVFDPAGIFSPGRFVGGI